VVGDVRDEAAVRRSLAGVDKVVHLAAEVGVGQSMYAVDRYVSVNDHGTAVLFQQLIEHPVKRVVVASSMSIYGEGLYRTADGALVEDAVRRPRAGAGAPWDPVDDRGRPLVPVPTPEWKRPALASVYAITKHVQERLTLTLAPAYGMEGVALRCGTSTGRGRRSPTPTPACWRSSPRASTTAKRRWSSRTASSGATSSTSRTVARAFLLALDHPARAGEVYNIASGEDRSVEEVAAPARRSDGPPGLLPEITGKARAGDIRHCIADLAKARAELGLGGPRDFAQGLAELAEWVGRQQAEDRVAPGAARAGSAGPRGVTAPSGGRPRPGDGRRGLHRLQPRRPPRARRARGAGLRRAWRGRAWRPTSPGCRRGTRGACPPSWPTSATRAS
jgi:dTDP-L-rhamnose 4-epimerase